MASQTSLLIPEIISRIAESIDDLPTLKNLALACKMVNAVVEGILWRNVTVSIQHMYGDWYDLPVDRTCPIWTLRKEEWYQSDPESFLDEVEIDEVEINGPPIRQRSPLVRHISLRNIKVHGEDNFESGFSEDITLRIFRTETIMFPWLQSVRIDGDATQAVWDALLELPMLKELRIWRSGESRDAPLTFYKLAKLRSLELGLLSPQEGFALGLAALGSALKSLHFSVFSEEKDTTTAAVTFLSALSTKVAISNTGVEGEAVGSKPLPPLVELGIEGDFYM
jgi:hypothetical protein